MSPSSSVQSKVSNDHVNVFRVQRLGQLNQRLAQLRTSEGQAQFLHVLSAFGQEGHERVDDILVSIAYERIQRIAGENSCQVWSQRRSFKCTEKVLIRDQRRMICVFRSSNLLEIYNLCLKTIMIFTNYVSPSSFLSPDSSFGGVCC